MSASNNLPQTMKALVLASTSTPPTIETVSVPGPTIASATVQILTTTVISYTRDILNGKRSYPFPQPLIPGFSAVGRIAALPIDATKLKVGDLVFVDCLVRSRDDNTELYLAGIHEGYSEGAKKLARDVYRDWTFAEYARVPIENLTPFNEKKLLGSPTDGGFGYSVEQLGAVARLLVPYGGLKDIDLQAGETVIVAPSTGPFGSAAVLVALAMGARVIAMGRNRDALATLKKNVPFPERVETVPITGDMQADCAELKKYGPIDAYFDIGPPEAHASTHIKSAILALSHGARISLMGGYREDVAIPHVKIMHSNMRLFGKWMYERSDIVDFVKLVEKGMLRLDESWGFEKPTAFSLDDWKEGFDQAAEQAGFGKSVVIKP